MGRGWVSSGFSEEYCNTKLTIFEYDIWIRIISSIITIILTHTVEQYHDVVNNNTKHDYLKHKHLVDT